MASRRTHARSSKRTRELMAEVRVASLADLAPGQPVRAEAAGAAIVLARVGDQVFGCGDTCAHKGGALSGGRLTGARLASPRHGWAYAVRARASAFPRRGARAPPHPGRPDADGVFVE